MSDFTIGWMGSARASVGGGGSSEGSETNNPVGTAAPTPSKTGGDTFGARLDVVGPVMAGYDPGIGFPAIGIAPSAVFGLDKVGNDTRTFVGGGGTLLVMPMPLIALTGTIGYTTAGVHGGISLDVPFALCSNFIASLSAGWDHTGGIDSAVLGLRGTFYKF
jgi:hypothetical protein